MAQPKGFEVDRGCDDALVYRLRKSIYGLKQASRQWNIKFDTFLKRYGLVASSVDPCVYFTSSNIETINGIFVDDELLCSIFQSKVTEMLDYLQTHFDIVSSATDYYVGFEITRCRVSRVLFISQEWYILWILEHFGISNCQIVSTLFDPHVHLELNLDGPHVDFPYKEAVGCLLYALVICCPDIAYTVNCVAKYVDNPSNIYVTTVKWLFQYLHGIVDFGIVYIGYPCDLQLVGWCDADYATDRDAR